MEPKYTAKINPCALRQLLREFSR